MLMHWLKYREPDCTGCRQVGNVQCEPLQLAALIKKIPQSEESVSKQQAFGDLLFSASCLQLVALRGTTSCSCLVLPQIYRFSGCLFLPHLWHGLKAWALFFALVSL